MNRIWIVAVVAALMFPSVGQAKVCKLGDRACHQSTSFSGNAQVNTASVSCLDNEQCPYDKECVALQCEDVCKNAVCPAGLYCAPYDAEHAHMARCAECVVDSHCPAGQFCDRDYTCKKVDPCRDAVCSPAAPFCKPVPYKTLPYTCVQCAQNSDCPPVAGLTRRCEDGYCLFNVSGNVSPAADNGYDY